VLNKIPRPTPDFRLEPMDGELLLYHPGHTQIMYCNATASLVWQLCNGQRSGHQIATLLGNAYPETAPTIAADVELALRQFAQHGAVTLELPE